MDDQPGRKGNCAWDPEESEQLWLDFVRDWEHANDDPGVRCDEVELLRRAEEEMQVGFEELILLLHTNLFQGDLLIALVPVKTVPVERADLPIENLKRGFAPVRIRKPI